MLWLNGVRLPYASGAVWFEVTKTANADYTVAPDKPVFILALGNDGRPGDTSTRGDAIHLIGVNPVLAAGDDPRLPSRHRSADSRVTASTR